MKSFHALGLCLLVLPGAAPLPESGEVTLYGQYRWRADPGDPGNLRAVFTPAGSDAWQVKFYFRFDGRSHVYSGNAAGSLDQGRLSGEVENERGNRFFLFRGDWSNGTFSGTHSERKRGGLKDTGTLDLAPRGS